MFGIENSEFWFIVAQIFGAFGLILLLISFQINHRKKLLRLQVASCLMFVLQYICLAAPSGYLMNGVAMVRNYIYSRTKHASKILVSSVVLIIIILSVIFYDGPISLLPVIATVIYTVSFASSNLKIIRFSDVVACLFYIAYNISVGAYVGLLATILEMVFTIVAIVRFDFLKKSTKSKKLRKTAK